MPSVIGVFAAQESTIGSEVTKARMKSNQVLGHVRSGLEGIGFTVESGKKSGQKLHRPVFFGEMGQPTMRYEIDAYHDGFRCGLEVEAVRALRGNAVYRDIVQALLMVDVDHLVIAVPNYLKVSALPDKPFEQARRMLDPLFSHSRVRIPYGLTLLGY